MLIFESVLIICNV